LIGAEILEKGIISLALKGALCVGGLVGALLLTYGGLLLLTPTSKKMPAIPQVSFTTEVQMGKWMQTGKGVTASWLEQKHQGKKMQEPINIILIDEVSTSLEEAVAYMLNSCDKIGYPSRRGHSSDYQGEVDRKVYQQYPRELNHAFSDALYILPNNHGRIFGPHFHNGKYYFTGAFSREGIDVFAEVQHVYVSFEVAKQDFATRLHEGKFYKIAGKVDMQSRIENDDVLLTSGDHDGTAVLLYRSKN
jgi:hypothetical protein